MGIQFLHTADLHLGSQLKIQHQQSSLADNTLSTAVYTAVERLFDVALAENVDFVVVAGDLYDEDSRSVRANTFLKEQFERFAERNIPVYVAYGNHDPVGAATTYIELPDNVHEFDAEEPEEYLYPNPDSPEARIWGQSYRDPHESRSMYRRFTPDDDRIPNIGVLHTGLNPDGRRYVPVARSKLEGKDEIHYWALGHKHDPHIYTNTQPIAYPGVPQGRQSTEQGLGGGYLVELETNQTATIEFVPTSPVVWQTVDVDVSDETVTTIPDIERAVNRAADDLAVPMGVFDETPVSIRDPEWGINGYICRWRLVGNGPAHETLSRDEEAIIELSRRLRQRLMSRETFVWTESVRDTTGPPVPPIDELRGKDPIIDEFLEFTDEFEDESTRDVFRQKVGDAWEPVDDHEETQPDQLPLTDDHLDDLIDHAQQRVLETLALRRAN
jgi:exonuclease SbcD